MRARSRTPPRQSRCLSSACLPPSSCRWGRRRARRQDKRGRPTASPPRALSALRRRLFLKSSPLPKPQNKTGCAVPSRVPGRLLRGRPGSRPPAPHLGARAPRAEPRARAPRSGPRAGRAGRSIARRSSSSSSSRRPPAWRRRRGPRAALPIRRRPVQPRQVPRLPARVRGLDRAPRTPGGSGRRLQASRGAEGGGGRPGGEGGVVGFRSVGGSERACGGDCGVGDVGEQEGEVKRLGDCLNGWQQENLFLHRASFFLSSSSSSC